LFTKYFLSVGDNYQPQYIVKFKVSQKTWSEETHEDFELSELKAILANVLAVRQRMKEKDNVPLCSKTLPFNSEQFEIQ
jgi:hypothetical protein